MNSDQEGNNAGEDQQTREFFHLDDIIDLSVVQVFILILLSSFPVGTVRYTVFQILNSYLEADKQVSASSFYNSLLKLEKKGYINLKKEKNEKNAVIELTQLASHALNNIGILAILSHANLMNWASEVAEVLIQQVNLDFPVDSVLVISQDKSQNLHVYPFIEKYAKHVHALASEHDFERYIKPCTKDIHPSACINKKVREPDDFFDAVILPSYQGTPYLGLSKSELLEEAIRVTKSKGYLMIITISKPALIGHFLLDPIAKLVQENLFFHCLTEEELRKDLEIPGLESVEIFNRNGILLGMATVK